MPSDNTATKEEFEVQDLDDDIIPRPFLKWAGGKRQLLPELLRRVPAPSKISTYFEPFLGGGALFFRLQPPRAYLADLNSELINAYKAVKNNLAGLMRGLNKHRCNEEYFYELRNADRTRTFEKWSNVRRASRLIFLNKTCFNGLYRVNSKGQFNAPFGRYVTPTIYEPENLKACSAALQKAELRVASFLEIEKVIKKKDFVYFDPPYAPINGTSYFTDYSKEGFDTNMQVELRDLCARLDKRGVRFMVSNSDVGLINDLYSKFNIEKVFASRAINSNGAKRGKITELIIRNYD